MDLIKQIFHKATNIVSPDTLELIFFPKKDPKAEYPLKTIRYFTHFDQIPTILAHSQYVACSTACHMNVQGDLLSRHQLENVVLAKILTLDVDLDNLRKQLNFTECSCGEEKKCCKICWRLMAQPLMVEIEIYFKRFLNSSILFNYSGNKGFHGRALNAALSTLSPQNRLTILNHMEQWLKTKLPTLFNNLSIVVDIFDKLITTQLIHPLKLIYTAHPTSGFLALPITPLINFENLSFRIQDFNPAVHLQILEQRNQIVKKLLE